MEDTSRHSEIKVNVTFPISSHGPYEAEVTPETTVETVLASAMEHFKVQDDSQFTYALAHDGKEQDNTTPVGSIAGNARAVRFILVKKITQG